MQNARAINRAKCPVLMSRVATPCIKKPRKKPAVKNAKSPAARRGFSVKMQNLEQLHDGREQRVGERVGLETFEHAELVEHDLACAERNHLQVDAGLHLAILQAYGAPPR